MTRRRWMYAVAGGLLAAAVLVSLVSGLILDGLWMDQLGYLAVFWKILGVRVGLFVVGLAVAFLYAGGHVVGLGAVLASGDEGSIELPIGDGRTVRVSLRAVRWIGLGLAAFLALGLAGTVGAAWDLYLRFRWGGSFGVADPLFGRDVGFYVFRLPLLELAQNSLTVLTGTVFAGLVALYAASGTLLGAREGRIALRAGPLRHLAVALAVFLAAWAWGYQLDRYELLLSPAGAVYGAGYTDAQVLRYALVVMGAASVLLAVVVVVGAVRRRGRVALVSVMTYLGLLGVALWLWPGIVQTFRVEPNELELETPYLRHNIAFTRRAYGLDRIVERDYPARADLAYGALADNRATLHNIRLWDWRPLTQTYRQMQEIRTYYHFYEVDVDRYRLEDDVEYRQVMLSARELGQRLPATADTWVNRVLQFTHGYGLAMSLATQEDTSGVPHYLIRDLPPVTEAGLSVTQPAIYYGEKMPGYRVVATGVRELDYPKGDDNVYTSYGGSGGIPLDGLWKRVLCAWELADVNLLLSSYIGPQSRLQLWRRVQERVGRIAPFLELDPDPYLVLSEGRLYWIQDAYTASDRYPYSEPYQGRFNYLRNAVKVVVDAYEGTVTFYAVDPEEPVLAAYARAFPGVFRSLDDLSADLKRHLRYPAELFRVQVAKYNAYHMTVPQVYYNREDLWTVPQEKYAGSAIEVEPYYVLMRLPEGEGQEFLLMIPLTPSNKDNMIAWLAARCDAPHYGEMVVYKLPKERLIYGPLQVEAVIDQNTAISQQLSLWDQRGSQVIRGNLLVIPIEGSFLYVEPVYLVAEGTDIPQLRRVIVARGDQVAMEPTLEGALRSLFGVGKEAPPEEGRGAPAPELSRLQRAYRQASEALREGRWADFGAAMDALEKLLGGPTGGAKDRETP